MPSKPTRTALQLREVLLERIEAMPGIGVQVTHVHTCLERWPDAGPGEPNRFVPIGVQRDDHRRDPARIVGQTQVVFQRESN